MKYVAFLRGISPMNAPAKKLAEVFEDVGFTGVTTVLSSGNVVFDSPHTEVAEIKSAIEQAMLEKLGVKTTAMVRSAAQIRKIVQSKPFGTLEHSRETYLMVTFLGQTPEHKPTSKTIGDAKVACYAASTLSLYPFSTPEAKKRLSLCSSSKKRLAKMLRPAPGKHF